MADSESEDLPVGWIQKVSSSTGKKYYFNTRTNQSKWERPTTETDDAVRASHILVKHKDSRRPSSWKEETITRTKEEAVQILLQIRARIVNKEVSFADAAMEESHCSSARNGGDLGIFRRGQMQKPFENVTYAMNVGELSEVVDTDSGVHIILRTA